MRSDPCFGPNGKQLPGAEDRLGELVPDEISTISSFPEASNEWGHSGTRYPGPTRGFPARGAAPFRGHVAIASRLPCPTANGFHISPGDIREAALFIAKRGALRRGEFLKSQLLKPQCRSRLLAPSLDEIRGGIDVDRFEPRAMLRAALFEELFVSSQRGRGKLA